MQTREELYELLDYDPRGKWLAESSKKKKPPLVNKRKADAPLALK